MDAAGVYDAHALHGFARDSIARGSKSFALASQLFDRETRERVWLLYAWCRAADDLTDGQDHGGAMSQDHDAQAALARIRTLTDAAFAGQPTGDQALDALGYLLTEVAIPRDVIDDIIAGFALDADDWRPRSEADLLRYCYHVAGAVGVAMALVMGVDPADEATLDRASDLGIAFQLVDDAIDYVSDAATMGCRFRLSARSAGIGAQMKPDDQRTVQATHSGVASSADMMTSPSFSRFSSSATRTGRPARRASRACWRPTSTLIRGR